MSHPPKGDYMAKLSGDQSNNKKQNTLLGSKSHASPNFRALLAAEYIDEDFDLASVNDGYPLEGDIASKPDTNSYPPDGGDWASVSAPVDVVVLRVRPKRGNSNPGGGW